MVVQTIRVYIYAYLGFVLENSGRSTRAIAGCSGLVVCLHNTNNMMSCSCVLTPVDVVYLANPFPLLAVSLSIIVVPTLVREGLEAFTYSHERIL